eukprot:4797330-Pleurochrysis_carterae.AAC.1
MSVEDSTFVDISLTASYQHRSARMSASISQRRSARMSASITQRRSASGEVPATMGPLLLYLNKATFVGEEGFQLAQTVRAARTAGTR